jgi:hypothetical protein
MYLKEIMHKKGLYHRPTGEVKIAAGLQQRDVGLVQAAQRSPVEKGVVGEGQPIHVRRWKLLGTEIQI